MQIPLQTILQAVASCTLMHFHACLYVVFYVIFILACCLS